MKNTKYNLINIDIKKNIVPIYPTISYENADTQKVEILKANKDKSGIYRWTHKEYSKSYVGSAFNLSYRLKNYYNLSYLERETKINSSMIYKALIKYGYSSFKLDILEYCTSSILISREQYYLNNLNPAYNILKYAGSVKGFKHDKVSIEAIRASKLGRNRSEEDKLKIAVGNTQSLPVNVTNNKTDEVLEFTSIRKASKFIGKHHSYVTKCLNNNKLYKNENFTINVK